MWDTVNQVITIVLAFTVWVTMYYLCRRAGAFTHGVPAWLIVAAIGAVAVIGGAFARLLFSPDGHAETIIVLIVLAGLVLELAALLQTYLAVAGRSRHGGGA
jgi:tellurite resistance protein TehA-like permease